MPLQNKQKTQVGKGAITALKEKTLAVRGAMKSTNKKKKNKSSNKKKKSLRQTTKIYTLKPKPAQLVSRRRV